MNIYFEEYKKVKYVSFFGFVILSVIIIKFCEAL